MANGADTVGVKLSLNVTDFMAGANQARETIKKINADFKESVAGMDNWRKSIDGVDAKLTQLQRLIDAHNRTINNYEKRLEKLNNSEGNHDEAIKHLNEGMQSQRTIVKNLEGDLRRYTRIKEELVAEERYQNSALGRLNRTIKEQEVELAELITKYKNLRLTQDGTSDEIFQLENRIKTLNSELRENRNLLAEIDGSADALTAFRQGIPKGFTVLRGIASNLASDAIYSVLNRIGEGLRDIVNTTIEWESAFTGVRRTVEGSEDDFIQLERELRGMSTTVATSLSGIADIATLAGQMGIPIDQISEFTRVMIMLGDTTNITAEEAGDSLARLSNLLNLSTEDFERMGSTIVDLGNKFPTTESEIATMASRLGGTANMLGITADEVLGIANAISAVGLEAEMGGNAVSKTLREMQLAVENGTENLSIFASTAGMTVDQFAELFSTDATGALQAFINGLGDVGRNGQTVTQILKSLNITELRQVDTLSRLATNTDTLNDSLEVAKSAWESNTALAVEANKRYQTIESRLQMMKNAWSDVAIEIADRFTPALRGAIDFATGFARVLTGQKGASEQLDVAMTNLRSATQLFRDAQDEATDSTDALTRAMVQLRKEQQKQSFIEFAGVYQNSIEEVENAQTRLNNAIRELSDSTYSQLFEGTSGDIYKSYLINAGFNIDDTSVSNILSMYDRIDEIERRSRPTNRVGIRNDSQTAFKKLYDLLKDAETEIAEYEDALKNLDITSEQVWENQEIALKAYANLFESGDISSYDLVGKVDEELIDVFKNVEEGWTRGTNLAREYLKTINDEEGLRSYQDALNEQLKTLDLTSDGYWGIISSLEQINIRASELGINLVDNSKEIEEAVANLVGTAEESAQSIFQSISRNLLRSQEIASATHQPFSSEDAFNIYSQGYSEIVQYRRDIARRLNEALATDATNSPLIKYLEDELEQSRIIEDQIKNSLDEHYRQMLIDDIPDIQEMQEEFQNSLRLNARISNALGEPVEREDLLDTVGSQIRDNYQKIDELRKKALKTSDEKYKAELEQSARDIEAWTEELSSTYKMYIPREGEDSSIPAPDEESLDWWTEWTGNFVDESVKKFGEGLQAMVSDLSNLWNTIGGGVLDIINSQIDYEMQVLDRMEEDVQERLDNITQTIEDNQKIQENNLRKQLRDGVIDEETYYRESASNKYDAEAKKRQAEEETAKAQKDIQEKREALERKQFEADKANSIADVWISAAQGIASAWSHGEPISAGIITGLITAMAGVQTGLIASQQYTPALATGGIVTAPTTALIGEAGKEAVLPLEQNTDWMDELAYRIGSIVTSERIRTAIDRTLNEDGRTVDKTSNMQFTQIINSPKALSRKEIYRDTRRLVRMVDRRTS